MPRDVAHATSPVNMLYGLVIFLGAFLLFQVQPLIAKVILPWFGGSAAVWLTCLVFFQVALLLGYLYAHWLMHRVPARLRNRLHILFLSASCFFLPVLPGASWKPVDPAHPGLRIVFVLVATVGLPYLLLAATSPLVQAWYAQRHSSEPYRFFAVSNAGSLLGLLSYPMLVEPFLGLRQQAWLWSGGFLIFAAALAGLALRGNPAAGAAPTVGENLAAPVRMQRALWIALPACASALLLAITNHLTQNVAPFPFLWVLLLSLYLLSFVVTFGRRSWYGRSLGMRTMALALAVMAYALGQEFVNAPVAAIFPIYAIGLFVCCLMCHGELVRLKPPPAQLTSFYLQVSFGGSLGGLFVTVIAPLAYNSYYELHVAMGSCAALALLVLHSDPRSTFYRARWQPLWLGLVALVLALAGNLFWTGREAARVASVSARNFYGTLRVVETSQPRVIWMEGEKANEFPQGLAARKLIHGVIDHGVQYRDVARRHSATAYYVASSGVALAVREAAHRGPARIGVVGLGTGTMAALGVRGDVIRFYEINPQVIAFAKVQFTYLEDATAKIEIVPGDARLSMEREPPQNYDVLAVDAFSGDAIPVHLLTLEAFREYFRHIKPGGALVLHISNQHLDLQPVVQKAADALQKKAVVVESTADEPLGVFRAFWVIVSDRAELFADPEIQAAGKSLRSKPGLRVWTDEYSNLLQVLNWPDLRLKMIAKP